MRVKLSGTTPIFVDGWDPSTEEMLIGYQNSDFPERNQELKSVDNMVYAASLQVLRYNLKNEAFYRPNKKAYIDRRKKRPAESFYNFISLSSDVSSVYLPIEGEIIESEIYRYGKEKTPRAKKFREIYVHSATMDTGWTAELTIDVRSWVTPEFVLAKLGDVGWRMGASSWKCNTGKFKVELID